MCYKKELKGKIEVLCNKKLQYITRSLDLICLGFGELTEEIGRNENVRFIAEYGLHVQCPFRICHNNSIILSSADLYISNIDENADVNLDEKNTCAFDMKSLKILDDFPEQYVTSIELSSLNDLQIKTQGIVITLFLCDTTQESWRFFSTNSDEEHIVV